MPNTGALITAVPAEDDPIHQLSNEDCPHITMLWFGEAENLPQPMQDELLTVVVATTQRFAPFDVQVSGVALLGSDKASVLLVESEELVELRAELAMEPIVQEAYALAEHQFPNWVPHLTLDYGTPICENPPETIRIDSLGFWLAAEKRGYPLQAPLDVTAAAFSVPQIDCIADLQLGISYAAENPGARWYIAKRACALGEAERIPAQWGES